MGIKIIERNKRASFDFFLLEKYEAGIVLQGTEVKSLRAGKVSLTEAYVHLDEFGEVWLYNMNIAQYEFGNIHNHEEGRKRKLLLHKAQAAEIYHRMKAEKLTIIPTQIYFKDSKVKVEIALAKGKKQHDKRQTEAKRDVERKLRRGDYD
ncbi:MAG: SsrA-binding protein SmpB [Bdellovibrio sp.]